jgi:aspartyl-tRNA synthetase
MVRIIREEMERDGFVDIETPIMWKPTPEGARDFLVPTRLQKGRFFALPQSPQIAKQLLVISGFERYYQIARCFRDEDLRADRLQELTQLDVETAFPDQEYLFALMERIVRRVWLETIGVELETPFPRMSWDEADLRYGSDKPDLRFGLEIEDATEVTRGSQFGVFANAPAVRFLTVSSTATRARCARRSPSSCPRRSSTGSAPTRARRCSSAPTSRSRCRGRSARSASGWAATSASSTTPHGASSG